MRMRQPPTCGLEVFSIIYTGWFASQKFYSEQIYKNGTLAPIRSDFGHLARGGLYASAAKVVDAQLRELLR